MNKVLTAGLILMTALLLTGSIVFPDHASMWLASTSLSINIVRVLMIAVLLVLLFTNPPRSYTLRAMFGMAAGVVFTVFFGMLANSTMYILDMMVFAQASVILGLEALEFNPNTEAEITTRSGSVLRYE